MKKILSILSQLVIGLIIFSFPLNTSGQVQPKPLWATKGVKHLNDDRISKDYEFVAFHHEFTDQNIVTDDNLSILILNMAEHFNVNPENIIIDSIADPMLNRVTYSVSFPAHDKDEITRVYVQPVDSYQHYNNNIDGSFDYIFDELYAISDKDITPVFDNFEVTRKYNALPIAMSLIPGLGQIYKGQPAKGYSILSAEIIFCGAIAFGEINCAYYMKKARKDPDFYDSWKSKANSYRAVRNIGIVLGSATYLYNLIDATFAKGAPHVIVKQAKGNPLDIVFSPIALPDSFGFGVVMTF